MGCTGIRRYAVDIPVGQNSIAQGCKCDTADSLPAKYIFETPRIPHRLFNISPEHRIRGLMDQQVFSQGTHRTDSFFRLRRIVVGNPYIQGFPIVLTFVSFKKFNLS